MKYPIPRNFNYFVCYDFVPFFFKLFCFAFDQILSLKSFFQLLFRSALTAFSIFNERKKNKCKYHQGFINLIGWLFNFAPAERKALFLRIHMQHTGKVNLRPKGIKYAERCLCVPSTYPPPSASRAYSPYSIECNNTEWAAERTTIILLKNVYSGSDEEKGFISYFYKGIMELFFL